MISLSADVKPNISDVASHLKIQVGYPEMPGFSSLSSVYQTGRPLQPISLVVMIYGENHQ